VAILLFFGGICLVSLLAWGVARCVTPAGQRAGQKVFCPNLGPMAASEAYSRARRITDRTNKDHPEPADRRRMRRAA
jgi:hypothetical protein